MSSPLQSTRSGAPKSALKVVSIAQMVNSILTCPTPAKLKTG